MSEISKFNLSDFITSHLDIICSWFIYDPQKPLLFNSPLFLGMFTIFYILYVLIRNQRYDLLRKVYLIVFSLFFYYKAGGNYYILLLICAVITHLLAKKMYVLKEQSSRKLLLSLIIIANLGMLAYYKYTNFFIQNINEILNKHYELWDIILPIGISFFVFEAISYAVDLYRREMEPAHSTLDFCFYISFFPKLVAGPIIRAKDFLPQMYKPLHLTRDDMSKALFLILLGLIKKAVISDYISTNFVDRVFDAPELYSSFENLMSVYGYTLQIYCDFSGYSDIAIGLSLLMGFSIPPNFLTPYKSKSITEFWRRWHISLSSWLRDYLYISLGGNRKGKVRTYFNLFMTMLIGGLWHGASWKFVIWGGLHGGILAVERFYKQMFKKETNRILYTFLSLLVAIVIFFMLSQDAVNTIAVYFVDIDKYPFSETFFIALAIIKYVLIVLVLGYTIYIMPNNFVCRFICILLTFHFVAFCWIFFRAGNFNLAGDVIAKIGDLTFEPDHWLTIITAYKNVFILVAIGYILHFLPEHLVNWIKVQFSNTPMIFKAIVAGFVFWLVFATMSSGPQPFIYFQF